MKSIVTKLLCSAVLVGFSSAAIAETTCTRNAMAGRWMVDWRYTLDAGVSGGVNPVLISYCDAQVNNRGFVTGTCLNTGTGRTFEVTGRFSINAQCLVTGFVDDGTIQPVIEARVTSTNRVRPDIITGIAIDDPAGPGFWPTGFTATRRGTAAADLPAPQSAPADGPVGGFGLY